MMSLDENGTADLTGVTRALLRGRQPEERYRRLTTTGVIIKRSDFPIIKHEVLSLKETYWAEGYFAYSTGIKRVCFHSRDIRKRSGPFGVLGSRYDDFIKDLWTTIANIPFTVVSSNIDKLAHVQRYRHPEHPYALSLKFVLERFCAFLRRRSATGLVLLESRGEKEDFTVLGHAVRILDNGTDYYSPHELRCIQGIYFNPKWNADDEDRTSFFSLEIADLVSYPIFQHFRDGIKTPEFEVIEKKIYGYPNYRGRGLKFFP